MSPLRPRRLSPGDRVAVIAPSGPVPRDGFEAGMALLGQQLNLRLPDDLFRRRGFLAGSDEQRGAELLAALADPSVRAILCARGGYGAMRLLPVLPPSLLSADPKPIIGFSDITALHAAWLAAGLTSLHAPHPTQLPRLTDPAAAIAELSALLTSPDPPASWSGLDHFGPAGSRRVVVGRAVGGNLEVLTRLLGTPWMPPLDGAVLFLEEVGERPYRLDRQLTQLRLAGLLDRVAAIVTGEFVDCDSPDGSERAAEVIAERLSGLPIPVLIHAPFGHGARNRAFVHNGLVRVDEGAGRVEFLEGAVG